MVALRSFFNAKINALGLFFAVVTFAAVPAPHAFAAPTPEGCFTTTGTTTKTITNYNETGSGCGKDVEIPATIAGAPVVSISAVSLCNGGFSCKDLNSVKIPDSVTNISQGAFYASRLTSVTLPNGLTQIKDLVFGANNLTSITIPSTVTSIGSNALFANQLISVDLPPSLTFIGNQAFSSNKLTSVTIPSTVTSLGEYSFQQNEIESFIVTGSPAYLGVDILQNNPVQTISLNGTVYTAPSTQTQPLDACFTQSSGTLTSYLLNDLARIRSTGKACMARDIIVPGSIGGASITKIGDAAMRDKRLTAVVLPSTITSIGSQAFHSNRIVSVNVPPSVTAIGDYAFYDNRLTNITLPNTMTSLGEGTFMYNKLNSIDIPTNLTTILPMTFYSNEFTTVTVPDSVTTIGERAFARNRLQSIKLPKNLSTIENGTFYANNLTTVTIPDTVTRIGDDAFFSNTLTSVVIPDSVTSIGDNAFSLQSPLGRGGEYDLWTDPEHNNSILASIWYVKLYTASPSNPNNLQDAVSLDTMELDGIDNDYDEQANLGGYLINPSAVTLDFMGQNGEAVQTLQTKTSPTSSTYLVSDGPEVPFPADLYSPTPQESKAMLDALSTYYRIGDTFTIVGPVINGVTPTPAQYSFVLGASSEMREFAYAMNGSAPNAVGSSSRLAETGDNIYATIAVSLIVVALSAYATLRSAGARR